ncbi:MAG TPA: hypothetical protein VF407_18035 [Polyangiaceae bacterium]
MRTTIALVFAALSVVSGVACGGTTADVSGNGDAGGGDGGTKPVGCTDGACLDGELDWGANGGLVSAVDSSKLSSCTAYVHSRTDSSSGSTLSCTSTLETQCGDTNVTAADVATALQDPDVTTALAGSIKIYGGDTRPCDGSVLEITYQGKTIDVGSDSCENCGGTDGCTPVPKGLRALATTLQNLDTQQLQTPNCKSAFGL